MTIYGECEMRGRRLPVTITGLGRSGCALVCDGDGLGLRGNRGQTGYDFVCPVPHRDDHIDGRQTVRHGLCRDFLALGQSHRRLIHSDTIVSKPMPQRNMRMASSYLGKAKAIT